MKHGCDWFRRRIQCAFKTVPTSLARRRKRCGRILVNRAHDKQKLKRAGNMERTDLDSVELPSPMPDGTIQETSERLLAGHVHDGAVSAIITSDQLMLPVGQVYSVHVDISANANGFVRILGTPADEFDSVMASGGAVSDFQHTVSFPTSGLVFDLPPGYTVNSVRAGIVNNQFVPEASTLGLSALSLAALLSLRRRGFPSTMAP